MPVTRGSTTMTVPPLALHSLISGGRCEFDAVEFAPQMMRSFAFGIDCGSADESPGKTCCHARPYVKAQIVCSISGAPRRANSSNVEPLPSTIPDDELYRYGAMLLTPRVAMPSLIRDAIRPSASSHDAARNSPSPFVPVRISGVAIRSGE